MTTHSGSTSEGYLPPVTAGSSASGTAVAPAPEDPTATFADVLQQQQGAPSTAPRCGALFDSALANAAAPKAALSVAATTTTLSSSALSTPPTLPSPATALAAKAAAPVPTVPDLAALTTAPTTTPAPKSKGTQASAKQAAPQAPEEETTGTSSNDENATANGSKTLLGGSDLSMMLARAAMLTANARPAATATATSTASSAETDAAKASDDASEDLPVLAWGTKPAKASSTEKKSTASTAGRSFIQPDTSSASTLGMALIASSGLVQINTQTLTHQQVTASSIAGASSLAGVSSDPLGSAGMASGKKEHEMNATLDLTDLMPSTGTTPVVTRPSADVNILLGSNNDFKDALTQVMHVAELSNLSATTPPLRVAIEIQTPPGAIVNLYVSKQPDNTYRAQLSTDDLQALNWVQGQIGSLKESTSTGVDVRWLPAQLETISAPATSSTADSGLNWNRGGQGQGWQSNQQQQADERQQSARQKRNGYAGVLNPDLSIPFLGALGRAA
jgi:hypothetical protein